MKLERIQTIQRLPIQIEEAWDFFTSPKNLSLITPHWLDYRLNLDPPEYLHPGTIISASIRPIPVISTSWISEITHIRPPQFYITEQRVGPFKLWHHEHHFRAIDEGVEIEDIIMYGMHFGMIGSFVHNVYLRKRLHEIFSYRAQTLEQRFGSLRKPKVPERPTIPEIFKQQQTPQQPAQPPQKPPAPKKPTQPRPVQAEKEPQGTLQPGTPAPKTQSPLAKSQLRTKPVPDLSNPPQSKPKPGPPKKPRPEKPQGGKQEKPGKPEPRKVTLDDIFHGTDD